MPLNFPRKRFLLMAWLAFLSGLMVARHADSRSLVVIDRVLTKSEEGGSSIIIGLRGDPDPAYKVIGLEQDEILIALKDTEPSGGLCNKQITRDGLIQTIEINKKPGNVSCLLVKLREPYTGIDDRIESGTGRLRVQITAEPGPSGKALKPSEIQNPARTKARAKSGTRHKARPAPNPESGSDSSLLPTITPAPVTLSRPGGIDRLLNPDSMDIMPDTGLFLQAAGHFEAGRWAEAIRILRELIKTCPGSQHLERAYFLLAKSFDRMHKKKISEHFVEVMRHYQDATSKFPDSVFVPDAMVSIGKCCSSVKNYCEALAYYSLVCENYREYAVAPEALFERGKILALTKKPQEAIKSYQQVEALYPETPFAGMAKIERAKALFEINSFKRSLGVLDEITAEQPNKVYEDPAILLYSGYNYYELGRLKESRETLCRVLNYYPDIESNHLVLTRIADTFREEGMEDKALKLYTMVLTRYPDSEGSLISMLRLSANIKKVEPETLVFPRPIEEIAPYDKPASEVYKEIMKIHGDNPLSQLAGLRLALQQHTGKDYEGSVNTLRDILAKYPDTPLKEQIKSALRAPLEAIFKREEQAGHDERIVSRYQQVKAILGAEDMPNLLLMLGNAYRRLHLYNRAIPAFEKAKKSYTAYDQPAALLFGLGESLYKVQRLEEARQALGEFVKRDPEDRRVSQAYFLLGDVMLRQKRYEKATAAFDAAMQKATDDSCKIDILLATAEASNCQGDYDKASRLMNRAIALMNQNKADSAAGAYETYQELGETYLKLGDNEKALSAFEKALKASPEGRDSHIARFRLAECYQGLRERDKTEKILNQIIASGDPFWTRMAEAKIDEIETDIRIEKFYSLMNGQEDFRAQR